MSNLKLRDGMIWNRVKAIVDYIGEGWELNEADLYNDFNMAEVKHPCGWSFSVSFNEDKGTIECWGNLPAYQPNVRPDGSTWGGTPVLEPKDLPPRTNHNIWRSPQLVGRDIYRRFVVPYVEAFDKAKNIVQKRVAEVEATDRLGSAAASLFGVKYQGRGHSYWSSRRGEQLTSATINAGQEYIHMDLYGLTLKQVAAIAEILK